MLNARSALTTAIVLCRRKTKESDLIVQLLSHEYARISAVAKSARTIHSKQRAGLEPGTLMRCQLIRTANLPILTQTTILHSPPSGSSLAHIRQLAQVLEIAQKLIPEWEEEPQYFELVSQALDGLRGERDGAAVREALNALFETLGYARALPSASLLAHAQTLSESKMKSWEYLQPQR